jgi:hypothetical protein
MESVTHTNQVFKTDEDTTLNTPGNVEVEKYENELSKELVEAKESFKTAQKVVLVTRAKSLKAIEVSWNAVQHCMRLEKRKRDTGPHFNATDELKEVQAKSRKAFTKKVRKGQALDDALEVLMWAEANLRNVEEKRA